MPSFRFWLDQHGCAKNQVDGEEILARLEAAGHREAASEEEADLVLVNSCGFIEDARKESIDAVIALRARHPGKRILLAGCLAQRYALELAGELPEADGIVGNADLSVVVGAAEATMAGGRPVLLPPPVPAISGYPRRRLLDFPGTAHVKITEGCSNRCSYCAIPLIRGNLRSRSVPEVLAECRQLLGRGIAELVLVGQDLGSFGRERGFGGDRSVEDDRSATGGQELPGLLRGLSALPGDFRVRVMYVHPDNFPRGILSVMAADPRILPYLDIPFQHASPSITRAMNRRGGAKENLDLLSEIRAALPDAVIRSTFLVGFPGETEADFEALLAFQEKAGLDWLGAFTYSREEGTVAARMKGRVPARVARERKARVEELQVRITRERMGRFVGRDLEILVEEEVAAARGVDGDGGEPLSIGRAWLQAPGVDGLTVLRGSFRPGTLVPARVLALAGVDLDAVAVRVG